MTVPALIGVASEPEFAEHCQAVGRREFTCDQYRHSRSVNSFEVIAPKAAASRMKRPVGAAHRGPPAGNNWVAQLDERGYYETFEHPITGVHRYPGWPFTMTPGPTLGQHNDEVLNGLGLSDDEIGDLRARRVIGETAPNA